MPLTHCRSVTKQIPVKTVKPDDEEDEAWKAHPERPTYHYVFVLDVTESMAACMEARCCRMMNSECYNGAVVMPPSQ